MRPARIEKAGYARRCGGSGRAARWMRPERGLVLLSWR